MTMLRRLLLVVTLLAISGLLVVSAQTSGQPSNLNNIQCVITNSQTTIGSCLADAIPLSFIGIGVSLAMVGLAYMIGEVLNYSALKGFYKRELWETIKSMMIIAIIFSALIIGSAIAASFAGNSSTTTSSGGTSSISTNLGGLYTTANSMYLSPQLQDSYTNFAALLGLSVGGSLLQSLSLATWFPVPIPWTSGIIGAFQFGSSSSVLQSNYITAGDGATFSLIGNITTIVTLPVLFIFQFQYDLLFVIGAVGLGVFIPIGIVFRAVPFFRGIGGTMIAIGIGVALIYPALLVGFNLPITNYVYSLTSASAPSSSCPLSNVTTSHFICGIWDGFASVTGTVTGELPTALAFGPNFNTTNVKTEAGAGFWIGVIGPFKNGLFPALNFSIANSMNSLLQFILFAFDLIIGYALTNGIANLMGGGIKLGIGGFRLA